VPYNYKVQGASSRFCAISDSRILCKNSSAFTKQILIE
jgi:hypothetical protein